MSKEMKIYVCYLMNETTYHANIFVNVVTTIFQNCYSENIIKCERYLNFYTRRFVTSTVYIDKRKFEIVCAIGSVNGYCGTK